MRFPPIFAAFALVVAAPVAAQQSGVVDRPVAGSFTDLQAAQGDTVFQWFCASCHEQNFHTGEQFRISWLGRTLRDYFRTIRNTMPEDNPGGLSDEQYVAVIAYIMKLNGYPSGAEPLKTDTLELKRIRIGEPPARAAASP